MKVANLAIVGFGAVVVAQRNVCDRPPFSDLVFLSEYPPAQEFCSTVYPIPAVTKIVVAPLSTSTAIAPAVTHTVTGTTKIIYAFAPASTYTVTADATTSTITAPATTITETAPLSTKYSTIYKTATSTVLTATGPEFRALEKRQRGRPANPVLPPITSTTTIVVTETYCSITCVSAPATSTSDPAATTSPVEATTTTPATITTTTTTEAPKTTGCDHSCQAFGTVTIRPAAFQTNFCSCIGTAATISETSTPVTVTTSTPTETSTFTPSTALTLTPSYTNTVTPTSSITVTPTVTETTTPVTTVATEVTTTTTVYPCATADLKTDKNNCGACGNVCTGTRNCRNGRCVGRKLA